MGYLKVGLPLPLLKWFCRLSLNKGGGLDDVPEIGTGDTVHSLLGELQRATLIRVTGTGCIFDFTPSCVWDYVMVTALEWWGPYSYLNTSLEFNSTKYVMTNFYHSDLSPVETIRAYGSPQWVNKVTILWYIGTSQVKTS